MKILPKPYTLHNKIQHYEWGMKNADAFIPKFLGTETLANVPYAELWIGAHPSASSKLDVNGTRVSLYELVQQFPVEILGAQTAEKFHNTFPFLLKVLSASQALSIQTHPNKEQAKILHQKDPKHYPDENHKPEIAIAIDTLRAIAGFRPVEEILQFIRRFPALRKMDSGENISALFKEKDTAVQKKLLRALYENIMRQAESPDLLKEIITEILQQLATTRDTTIEEEYFIQQFNIYGYDVGLFSFFFFNFIQLKPGQAIYTLAGVPHAYLYGNIVECMANSDNVVRAGLTPKYKDVDTLLEILRADFSPYQILNQEQKTDTITYQTSAEEFLVTGYSLNENSDFTFTSMQKPAIVLVLSGSIELWWNEQGEKKFQRYSKGESCLIPALLAEYEILNKEQSLFYHVTIP